MRFATIVFWVAGIWGLLVLTPLYFMFDLIGRNDPPPITHPGFFYGFVGVGLAWQVAFIIIATDPVRFRPLMIPSLPARTFFSASYLSRTSRLLLAHPMRHEFSPSTLNLHLPFCRFRCLC